LSAADKTDGELLAQLWRLQLSALIKRMESSEALSAAEFNVTRQFLADNGISLATIDRSDVNRAMRNLASRLPHLPPSPHVENNPNGNDRTQRSPADADEPFL
jgi:hypothetical protein